MRSLLIVLGAVGLVIAYGWLLAGCLLWWDRWYDKRQTLQAGLDKRKKVCDSPPCRTIDQTMFYDDDD